MAYVYRHIRLDKNEVFYIGIGSDEKGEYRRAFGTGTRNRNNYWINIVAKTNYYVEIMVDEISWEDACKKEIEFISLYKRQRDGGTLANLTFGGEGQLGMYGELNGMFGKTASEETRKKQSERKKGWHPPHSWKLFTEEARRKRAETVKSRTYTAWNKGIPCRDETKRKLREQRIGKQSNAKGTHWSEEAKERISIARTGKMPTTKGMKFTEERRIQNKHNKPNQRGVLQFDLKMNFIKEYYSLTDAAANTCLPKSSIYLGCVNGSVIGQYRWQYKKAAFNGSKAVA